MVSKGQNIVGGKKLGVIQGPHLYSVVQIIPYWVHGGRVKLE